MTKKGVYVLILKLDKESDIQIGKLGKLNFKKGFYAYTGSALGSGGFKRVKRHFNVSIGKNPTRKWHIDYILSKSKIVHVILLPTEDAIECKLARMIIEIPGISIIPGFGCTDCVCKTHLIYAKDELKSMITDVCNNIGTKNIIINSSSKENKENKENNESISHNMPFCPDCRSILIYNIFTDDWICENCGYTIYGSYFDY